MPENFSFLALTVKILLRFEIRIDLALRPRAAQCYEF